MASGYGLPFSSSVSGPKPPKLEYAIDANVKSTSGAPKDRHPPLSSIIGGGEGENGGGATYGGGGGGDGAFGGGGFGVGLGGGGYGSGLAIEHS